MQRQTQSSKYHAKYVQARPRYDGGGADGGCSMVTSHGSVVNGSTEDGDGRDGSLVCMVSPTLKMVEGALAASWHRTKTFTLLCFHWIRRLTSISPPRPLYRIVVAWRDGEDESPATLCTEHRST